MYFCFRILGHLVNNFIGGYVLLKCELKIKKRNQR